MAPAIHPGRLLKRELGSRKLSANRLALDLGVPSGRITDILNGRRSISADTAVRLSRYFGNHAQFWLDLQDFLHILHKHYIDAGGHFYLNGVGYLSDAESLVKALKESTYFHGLMSDREITQKCANVAFGSKYYHA